MWRKNTELNALRKTNVKSCIPCNHQNGVMIPQQDVDGNYVKPKFMICSNCRLVRNQN